MIKSVKDSHFVYIVAVSYYTLSLFLTYTFQTPLFNSIINMISFHTMISCGLSMYKIILYHRNLNNLKVYIDKVGELIKQLTENPKQNLINFVPVMSYIESTDDTVKEVMAGNDNIILTTNLKDAVVGITQPWLHQIDITMLQEHSRKSREILTKLNSLAKEEGFRV